MDSTGQHEGTVIHVERRSGLLEFIDVVHFGLVEDRGVRYASCRDWLFGWLKQ